MTRRTWLVVLLVLIAAPCMRSALAADEMQQGKVVTAGDGKIEIVNKNGENETFDVAPSAKITRNDKEATLEDLQQGDVVNLKLQRKGDKAIALSIAAMSPE